MKGFPLLSVMWLLDSALGSLPAPVSLHVESHNFHHVLHWSAGAGTPPGAHYNVYVRKDEHGNRMLLTSSKPTSVQLILDPPYGHYWLSVQAVYNHTESSESPRLRFLPYADTHIGPPTLSLAGCGNCIRVNVSLPAADGDSGVPDIHDFYQPDYKVFYSRRDGEQQTFISRERSFTLQHLQRGAEYCVTVLPTLRTNKSTQPSALRCAATSAEEPSLGAVVVGTVATVAILVIGGAMAALLCLYYAGFVCRLKAALPGSLRAALSRGYTLTPETMVPDRVSISPKTGKRKSNNSSAAPQPTIGGAGRRDDEEDEEEEEEEANVYMDRGADLSSGETSAGGSSGGVSRAPAAPEGLSLEAEPPESEAALSGDEEDEGAELPLIPEEEGEEEEEACHSPGGVDLFSVMLSAMAEEEEEEETGRRRDPAPPPPPGRTFSDAQTESADREVSGTGYEGRSKACEEEEEEEEEESGYMRHT